MNGPGQNWVWFLPSWDSKILRMSRKIDLIYCMLVSMQWICYTTAIPTLHLWLQILSWQRSRSYSIANQWIGFYMIGTSVIKELNTAAPLKVVAIYLLYLITYASIMAMARFQGKCTTGIPWSWKYNFDKIIKKLYLPCFRYDPWQQCS